MKSNIHPAFYFSAYPLKSVNLKENTPKPNLRVESKEGKTEFYSIESKVLPLINPYKAESYKSESRNRQSDAVQNNGVDWFCSYE